MQAFELYSFLLVTLFAIMMQCKYAALGKSRETFMLSVVYVFYIILLVENSLFIAVSLWVIVGLLSFYVVTLFNRRYEKEID